MTAYRFELGRTSLDSYRPRHPGDVTRSVSRGWFRVVLRVLRLVRNGKIVRHLAVKIMRLILVWALLANIVLVALKCLTLGPGATLLRFMQQISRRPMTGRALKNVRLGPRRLKLLNPFTAACNAVVKVSWCRVNGKCTVRSRLVTRLDGPLKMNPGPQQQLWCAERNAVAVPRVVLMVTL